MTSLAGKSQSWADAADEEDATTSSVPKLNKDAELPKELAEKLKLGKKKDAGSFSFKINNFAGLGTSGGSGLSADLGSGHQKLMTRTVFGDLHLDAIRSQAGVVSIQ